MTPLSTASGYSARDTRTDTHGSPRVYTETRERAEHSPDAIAGSRLDILHVGAARSPNKVNGVNATIWSVAKEQAAAGHRVRLLLTGAPDETTRAYAEMASIELLIAPVRNWRFNPAAITALLGHAPPDIAHLHSVFIPHHAVLARDLERRGIPYIITPNGGLSPHVLKRGKLKKWLYGQIAEKHRFAASSAITAVMPQEEAEIRSYVEGYAGAIPWIPNPVEADLLDRFGWNEHSSAEAARRVVYLGRFDIHHKGIDLLVQFSQLLPDVEFHLYGASPHTQSRQLRILMQNLPPNTFIHGPVFGDEKIAVLQSASMYIQTSRWEAFGIAVAEAMYLGVPCAIAETMNLAELFVTEDLGLVLPTDGKAAADRLAHALADTERLSRWSGRARDFARQRFHPDAIARAYTDVYRHIEADRNQAANPTAPGGCP